MRLGVSLPSSDDDPQAMARAYVQAGYSAAICPAVAPGQTERIRAIREAFAEQNVLLAEVGVWNIPVRQTDHAP